MHIIFEREKALLSLGEKTWKINYINDNEIILTYEHSDILVNLYSVAQDDESKNMFLRSLMYYLVNDKEEVKEEWLGNSIRIIHTFSCTSALVFFTLLQLGSRDNIFNGLKTLMDESDRTKREHITLVSFLDDLASYKNNYFDIELISFLLTFSKRQPNSFSHDFNSLVDRLKLSLANYGYDEIKKNILGINVEINKDKEQLLTLFSKYGFDQKYEGFLNEIDEFINLNNNYISSGMIGNLRSFMEGLLTDLAKRIASRNKEDIPKNEKLGYMGNIRNYLKNKLELSDNDNKLINSYIDVLHIEGGHSFTSEIEYFRLSKNIGIEISLFILSKAKNLNLLD